MYVDAPLYGISDVGQEEKDEMYKNGRARGRELYHSEMTYAAFITTPTTTDEDSKARTEFDNKYSFRCEIVQDALFNAWMRGVEDGYHDTDTEETEDHGSALF